MISRPDWASGISHAAGAVLAVVALIPLISVALAHGTARHLASFLVFGISLVLLYSASAVYHLAAVRTKVKQWLRRIDHMMVFVLIAGTYTPFCLVALQRRGGEWLLGAVWTLAILGMVFRVVWLSAPRWLYLGFYLLLGWMVVIVAVPLVQALPAGALIFLALGGLAYTVGAVFYGLRWPRLLPGVFGFHELWHFFVLAGSALHYWAVFRFLAFVG
ncbi:MAG: hemolysin III family protein [Selenomonadales bacterium]|nr:hemolysin III family protein [Selenomonadales bacterium]